jgi:virginiamycin B lyase
VEVPQVTHPSEWVARGFRSTLGRRSALAFAAVAVAILALAGRADAFIYWTNVVGGPSQLGTIGRANLDGTGVNQNFIGASNPQGVTVDGAHVYWSDLTTPGGDLGSGTIGQANLNGGSPNQSFIGSGAPPTFPGAVGPEGIAVDGAHVYWADSFRDQNNIAQGVIARANLDGTGVNDTFVNVQFAAPIGVAVDGTHVYWTGSNVIGRANLDGTGVNQAFITTADEPQGLAVDPSDTHIYWVNGGTGSIGRADLPNGDNVTQRLITGDPDSPLGIAVDGAHIYWTNGEGPGNAGTVARANLNATGVNESFITGAIRSAGVAVDAGTATCARREATIVGTGRPDSLRGTNGDDVIAAGGGNDTVAGRGGDDLICGGRGNDRLRGNGGDDVLRAALGNDTLGGGPGDDVLRTGPGKDVLRGGRDDDRLRAGAGADQCNGGSGRDTMRSC